MILIYTNKEDYHPTPVIRYLTEWGYSVFRLNTECLLTDYEFAWWCNDEGTDFYIRNTKNGLECYGHQITAVWERRPEKPNTLLLNNGNEEINRHNLEEANGFLIFLRYYTKDIYSLGSIVGDIPSSSKMLQLSLVKAIARNNQLPISVPDTCFANQKQPIIDVLKGHSWAVLKPIHADSVFLDDNHQKVFYTQKVNAAQIALQPDEAFTQTVSFVQNYVEKQYELRITAIKSKDWANSDVITCKIYSQDQQDNTGKTDWRQGYDHNLKFEIIQTPTILYSFCTEFLNALQLNFGCFDFILTPQGEYVFLECNPNGQWLFIQELTGFDIARKVAQALAAYEYV